MIVKSYTFHRDPTGRIQGDCDPKCGCTLSWSEAGAVLHRRAVAYAEGHRVSYSAALHEVARADPVMARTYNNGR